VVLVSATILGWRKYRTSSRRKDGYEEVPEA
jgi:hypothetical protein